MKQESTSLSASVGSGYGNYFLQPKHKVFLNHSGAQKGFVEQLCVDLKRCDRHPFFDKRRECLPIGKEFARLIFEAIEQCEVGVVVLSEEFFTSKWPMLELVAIANVKKRKPSFTIMPILLGITLSQCRDAKNHERWLSLWHNWGVSDSRIDLKDWENALHLFGPTNALKYNVELGEVHFREEIVEAICKLVPSETRFEDSHVQGRTRSCEVIHERIKQLKLSPRHGVHVVGLYGVGGIGKSTICKAMCNDVFEEFGGKVAHMELGSQSEEELLKDVLRRLTNMNLDHLGAMNIDEYRYRLKKDMANVKVFLTIDNMSSATANQALTLLRAKYGLGSVLLVTTLSLNELMSLGIDACACMEMPELEIEEARSLFLYHAACVPPSYSSNRVDNDLISSCVERCHFKKGNGICYHYHPLALQVLGEQLRCIGYIPTQWWSFLGEIDFLNPFGEPQHPMFSILRRSFDALNLQDQLLFMDIALFATYNNGVDEFQWDLYEWLGLVHRIPVKSVIDRLENLKRKSLLENLGNRLDRVDMHDLWREFARLETKAGESEKRRWMFEWDEFDARDEASVTRVDGGVNVRRMLLMDSGASKLQGLNMDSFPNVTVLRVFPSFACVQKLELNLTGLIHLKRLNLGCSYSVAYGSKPWISLVGLGSLSNLGFLRWSNFPSDSPCIGEIVRLTKLRVLDLFGSGRVPDLSSLVSLQMACFRYNDRVETIAGLSSKHTNLQYLNLTWCRGLRSCPGIGELVALQELRLRFCHKLIELPNLQKLKRLRKLDVRQCWLLRGLPGLGDLVSLLELCAERCKTIAELPDMRNLRNLRIVDLSHMECIKSLPGLDELVCLQSLKMVGCKNLTQLPDIRKLTNLKTLYWDPNWSLQSLAGSGDLISFGGLPLGLDGQHDGPNLRKLTKEERLLISRWQGQGFSCLAELVLLEVVALENCKGVRALPDLQSLSRLRRLEIRRGGFQDLSVLISLTSLQYLEIRDCDRLEALPDLGELAMLEKLLVRNCALLRDVRGLHRLSSLFSLDVSGCGFADLQGLAACSQLRCLTCRGCPIRELPDLSNFPEMTRLIVSNCVNLTKLLCTGPVSLAFEHLNADGCLRLQALPDLTNSRSMLWLDVSHSGVALSAQLIQDMKARWPNIRLVAEETSSRVRIQVPDNQLQVSRGSSRGIWRHGLGMIASLHCGSTRTFSAVI